VLFENAGELAYLGDRRIPIAALADRQLDSVIRKGRGGRQRQGCDRARERFLSHRILPLPFSVFFL
jgi:hypothetical protein